MVNPAETLSILFCCRFAAPAVLDQLTFLAIDQPVRSNDTIRMMFDQSYSK
jgi:hypothetical protein